MNDESIQWLRPLRHAQGGAVKLPVLALTWLVGFGLWLGYGDTADAFVQAPAEIPWWQPVAEPPALDDPMSLGEVFDRTLRHHRPDLATPVIEASSEEVSSSEDNLVHTHPQPARSPSSQQAPSRQHRSDLATPVVEASSEEVSSSEDNLVHTHPIPARSPSSEQAPSRQHRSDLATPVVEASSEELPSSEDNLVPAHPEPAQSPSSEQAPSRQHRSDLATPVVEASAEEVSSSADNLVHTHPEPAQPNRLEQARLLLLSNRHHEAFELLNAASADEVQQFSPTQKLLFLERYSVAALGSGLYEHSAMTYQELTRRQPDERKWWLGLAASQQAQGLDASLAFARAGDLVPDPAFEQPQVATISPIGSPAG